MTNSSSRAVGVPNDETSTEKFLNSPIFHRRSLSQRLSASLWAKTMIAVMLLVSSTEALTVQKHGITVQQRANHEPIFGSFLALDSIKKSATTALSAYLGSVQGQDMEYDLPSGKDSAETAALKAMLQEAEMLHERAVVLADATEASKHELHSLIQDLMAVLHPVTTSSIENKKASGEKKRTRAQVAKELDDALFAHMQAVLDGATEEAEAHQKQMEELAAEFRTMKDEVDATGSGSSSSQPPSSLEGFRSRLANAKEHFFRLSGERADNFYHPKMEDSTAKPSSTISTTIESGSKPSTDTSSYLVNRDTSYPPMKIEAEPQPQVEKRSPRLSSNLSQKEAEEWDFQSPMDKRRMPRMSSNQQQEEAADWDFQSPMEKRRTPRTSSNQQQEEAAEWDFQSPMEKRIPRSTSNQQQEEAADWDFQSPMEKRMPRSTSNQQQEEAAEWDFQSPMGKRMPRSTSNQQQQEAAEWDFQSPMEKRMPRSASNQQQAEAAEWDFQSPMEKRRMPRTSSNQQQDEAAEWDFQSPMDKRRMPRTSSNQQHEEAAEWDFQSPMDRRRMPRTSSNAEKRTSNPTPQEPLMSERTSQADKNSAEVFFPEPHRPNKDRYVAEPVGSTDGDAKPADKNRAEVFVPEPQRPNKDRYVAQPLGSTDGDAKPARSIKEMAGKVMANAPFRITSFGSFKPQDLPATNPGEELYPKVKKGVGAFGSFKPREPSANNPGEERNPKANKGFGTFGSFKSRKSSATNPGEDRNPKSKKGFGTFGSFKRRELAATNPEEEFKPKVAKSAGSSVSFKRREREEGDPKAAKSAGSFKQRELNPDEDSVPKVKESVGSVGSYKQREGEEHNPKQSELNPDEDSVLKVTKSVGSFGSYKQREGEEQTRKVRKGAGTFGSFKQRENKQRDPRNNVVVPVSTSLNDVD